MRTDIEAVPFGPSVYLGETKEMKRLYTGVSVLAAAVMLAACGGGSNGPAAPDSPAGAAVTVSAAPKTPTAVALGASVSAGTLTLSVDGFHSAVDKEGQLQVLFDVHGRNADTTTEAELSLRLFCPASAVKAKNGTGAGESFMFGWEDSDLAKLPGGADKKGTLLVGGITARADSGKLVACEGPATVQWMENRGGLTTEVVLGQWNLPADVVAKINAAAKLSLVG